MEDKSEKIDGQDTQNKKEATISKISNTVKIISLLTVSIFFLLIVIISISVYSSQQKAEIARQEKLENDRIAAKNLAKEQALKAEQDKKDAIEKIQKEAWEKAIAFKDAALKNPEQIGSAITKMNEIKNSMAGTDYEKKADAEISNLQASMKKAIDQVIAELAKKAEEPAGKKDFEGAADIFKNYSGTLSQESNDERLKIAEQHLASAREVTEKRKQFQEVKNDFLKGISSLILKNQIAEALTSYNDFTSKHAAEKTDDIEAVKSILETIKGADKLLLESCRNDIGKKTTVKIDGVYESVEISRIKEDNVYVRKTIGTTKIETKLNPANLSAEEKIKRSDKMEKSSKAVYVALLRTEQENYDNAEKALESGGVLSQYLSEGIKELKKEFESKKASNAAR